MEGGVGKGRHKEEEEEEEEEGQRGSCSPAMAHPGQAKKSSGERTTAKDAQLPAPTHRAGGPSFPRASCPWQISIRLRKSRPHTPTHGRLPAESATLPVRKSFIKYDTFPAASARPHPSHCPRRPQPHNHRASSPPSRTPRTTLYSSPGITRNKASSASINQYLRMGRLPWGQQPNS